MHQLGFSWQLQYQYLFAKCSRRHLSSPLVYASSVKRVRNHLYTTRVGYTIIQLNTASPIAFASRQKRVGVSIKPSHFFGDPKLDSCQVDFEVIQVEVIQKLDPNMLNCLLLGLNTTGSTFVPSWGFHGTFLKISGFLFGMVRFRGVVHYFVQSTQTQITLLGQ